VHFIKLNYEILYKEKSQWQDTFWPACNYMHVYFDWPTKNSTLNSCYNVNFSISWQYLALKLQKVQELQSGKWILYLVKFQVNGIFHKFKLELFIEVIFMETTEMWNKCPRKNDLQNQKQIKILTLQIKVVRILTICLLHTKDPFGDSNTSAFMEMNKVFKRRNNQNKHEQEKR
jgi:hypothetical protein